MPTTTRKRRQSVDDNPCLNEGFMDALIECAEMGWTTRRALACTCRAWRARIAAFFARPEAFLEPGDCSNENAAFLLNTLLKRHPKIVLTFRGVTNNHMVRACTLPSLTKWMQVKSITKKTSSGAFTRPEHVVSNTHELNTTASFFMGRAWATLRDGSIVMRHQRLPEDPPHDTKMGSTCRTVNTLCDPFYSQDSIPPHLLKRISLNDLQMIAGCYLKAGKAQMANGLRGTQNEIYDACNHHYDDQGAAELAQLINKKGTLGNLNLRNTFTALSRGLFFELVLWKRLDGKHITQLILNENNLKNHRAVNNLVRAIKDVCLPRLKHLEMCRAQLDDECMEILCPCFVRGGSILDAASLAKLEFLRMDHNEFGTSGLECFMKHATRLDKLRYLGFPGCRNLGSTILQSFAMWMKEEADWPSISTVHVCTVEDQQHRFGMEKAQKLVKAATLFAKAQRDWKSTLAMSNTPFWDSAA